MAAPDIVLHVGDKAVPCRRPLHGELDLGAVRRILSLVVESAQKVGVLMDEPVPGVARKIEKMMALNEDALTTLRDDLRRAIEATALDGTKGSVVDDLPLDHVAGIAVEILAGLGVRDDRVPKSQRPSDSQPSAGQASPAPAGSSAQTGP